MYQATLFKPPRFWKKANRYIYDNKTHRQVKFSSWDVFIEFLLALSNRPIEHKMQAELISPAIYADGTKRRNSNVLYWGKWIALDIDDVPIQKDQLNDFLYDHFNNYNCFVYNTASSVDSNPKFRVVFELDTIVESEDIPSFWHGIQCHFDSIADEQTKDKARCFFTPGNYRGAFNFTKRFDGDPISVQSIIDQYPYQPQNARSFIDRLPEQIQKQLVDYRSKKLENTRYNWTSYTDCPFVNKKLVREYQSISNIDGTGRYRMIYKIMCSIAGNAVSKGYPITESELVALIKQLDLETSNRYQDRPLHIEAQNALIYAYKNGDIIQ